MVEKQLIGPDELKSFLDDLIKHHASPGDPRRKPIRDAIADFGRTIRVKYDVPPKNQQN
jgi:hypothetical protein